MVCHVLIIKQIIIDWISVEPRSKRSTIKNTGDCGVYINTHINREMRNPERALLKGLRAIEQ